MPPHDPPLPGTPDYGDESKPRRPLLSATQPMTPRDRRVDLRVKPTQLYGYDLFQDVSLAHARRHAPIKFFHAPELPVPWDLSVASFRAENRDWRSVTAEQWKEEMERIHSPLSSVLYLRPVCAAVTIGTLQACLHGFTAKGGGQVEATEMFPPQTVPLHGAPDRLASTPRRMLPPRVRVRPGVHPLDAMAELEDRHSGTNLALLHFVPEGTARLAPDPALGPKLAALTLRTSFMMNALASEKHLHVAPSQVLDKQGGVLCSSNVSLIREGSDQGFAWRDRVTRFDIFTIAVPRHVHRDQWQQYRWNTDKALVKERVNLAVSCAAKRGVQVLAMAPIGCGEGCDHPPLEIADIIHQTVKANARGSLEEVVVASDDPNHDDAWFAEFETVLLNGRAPPVKFGDPTYPASPATKLIPYLKYGPRKKIPEPITPGRELRRTFL